jgi:glutathione synthase
MAIKIGVVMDDIGAINYKKDSTLAMLWEADKRGWEIFYFEQRDLYLKNGKAFGKSHALKVFHDEKKWFGLGAEKTIPLSDLDVILMRKDPPVDREYIYTTYILEQAERDGVFVLNKPQALRDANEKVTATWFPEFCPATLVTRSINLLTEFLVENKYIVCKPLDGMGGSSIFQLRENDPNAQVVFEMLTQRNSALMMAQKFIPEITAGDKRILLINGVPVEYVLARMPAPGQWRGNLAAGAQGVVQPLTENDKKICQTVGPVLRDKGLYFVGLDIIGNYLTEVNVTSPTCIRELDESGKTIITKQLFDFIEQALKAS